MTWENTPITIRANDTSGPQCFKCKTEEDLEAIPLVETDTGKVSVFIITCKKCLEELSKNFRILHTGASIQAVINGLDID